LISLFSLEKKFIFQDNLISESGYEDDARNLFIVLVDDLTEL